MPDFVGRSAVRSEPQRTGLTKVDPVQSAIDLQGCAQPSRAPRQVAQPLDAAISLHDRDAIGGLDRPDQDARAHAWRLAGDVEHERDAIGEIDIGMPALEKKHPITRGDATIGMTRGVADDIGFGLDDAPGRHALGQHPHHDFADEKTSKLTGIDGQFRPIQHARGRGRRVDFTPLARPDGRGKVRARTDRRSIGSRAPPCHPGTP